MAWVGGWFLAIACHPLSSRWLYLIHWQKLQSMIMKDLRFLRLHNICLIDGQGEPAATYKWTSWVWKLTSWSFKASTILPIDLKDSMENASNW
jgi:hypothetical protein